MRQIRAAIVGCGRIASLFSQDTLRKGIVTHAAAYKNDRRTTLVAACDIDPVRVKEFGAFWNIDALYTDVCAMLKEHKIDVLSICTPPSTHYDVLKKAAKSGVKAIFCEKPLSSDVKSASEMVMICKRSNILLQVDHQRRFDPLHVQLRNFIINEKAGSAQQANFYYTAGIKNTGSHMFDLLRFFFGDVVWIEAFFSKNESVNKDDPNLDGLLKFKNGLLATFQACDFRKYLIFELNCFLDSARLILCNSGFEVEYSKAGPSQYFKGYKDLYVKKAPFKVSYQRNPLAYGLDHLLKCFSTGKESISSGEDGLAAVKIIEAAIVSARNNGKRIQVKG